MPILYLYEKPSCSVVSIQTTFCLAFRNFFFLRKCLKMVYYFNYVSILLMTPFNVWYLQENLF